MRTIRTKVYTFNELNKGGQETAILLNSDINVEHDWWNFTYQDAKGVGLKLMGFDLDYKCSADGIFIDDTYNCANKIIKNHDEDSDSYKLAEQFIKEWDEATVLHSDGVQTNKVMEGKEFDFDYYMEDREKQFLKDVLYYYADYLQKECNYLQTDEAIKETLISNEYEFLSNGKMI